MVNLWLSGNFKKTGMAMIRITDINGAVIKQ